MSAGSSLRAPPCGKRERGAALRSKVVAAMDWRAGGPTDEQTDEPTKKWRANGVNGPRNIQRVGFAVC